MIPIIIYSYSKKTHIYNNAYIYIYIKHRLIIMFLDFYLMMSQNQILIPEKG